MQPTRYLVQASDDSLHGYDREDILRCDLATNKTDPPKRIYRLTDTALTIRYDPIDLSEIIDVPCVALSLATKSPRALQLPA